ncbi:hypothetical protein ADEAN_000076100 [Angomonas deanei]|uniref:Uncharacterized protein n=1 Tax=Angomonas deanei TaxID=59799 RepID=A0A7G2C0S3_9TRYP|nr:hypothetical protein ADEAN_000076100 [Angomonas deanei]
MTSAADSAEAQRIRDNYMSHFSEVFSDELVELYELDGDADAVRHLTGLIENGLSVWGYPPKALQDPVK